MCVRECLGVFLFPVAAGCQQQSIPRYPEGYHPASMPTGLGPGLYHHVGTTTKPSQLSLSLSFPLLASYPHLVLAPCSPPRSGRLLRTVGRLLFRSSPCSSCSSLFHPITRPHAREKKNAPLWLCPLAILCCDQSAWGLRYR